MVQWSTCFVVKSRDKAATCPHALLSFSAHWSMAYSWPLLYLEPTRDHRGKHHLGESFPSCKSAVIAIGMEAALPWCLYDFCECCVTTKTEQWCPKPPPQMCAAHQTPQILYSQEILHQCVIYSGNHDLWGVQSCRLPGFLRITVKMPPEKS